MANWFGNLDLAYKYVIVFVSLLLITIIAGFIKVLYNRQRLKKATKAELEAGPKEDTVELNQREKDEGDLFGIRAIEAGFYAGVAQSRPTSRAGSIVSNHPGAMSNSTLVGGSASSPLMKGQSANNSTLSLNLSAADATRRPPPPAMKLRPSEAELSGRHNHMVDMSLQVPPSPGAPPRDPQSMTFGSYEHDNDNFRLSDTMAYDSSSGQSPYNPPTTQLPTLPGHALRKESRSPSPENGYPRVQVHEPNSEHAQYSSSAVPARLQPRAYSSYCEGGSEASSMYSSSNSHTGLSAFGVVYHTPEHSNVQGQEAERLARERPLSDSSTAMSGHTSILGSMISESESQARQSGLVAPGQSGATDSRLSEFYEAYYRNSHVGPAQSVETMQHTLDRRSVIIEVDTPLASPMVSGQPGTAF
ncbi:hypothetical protein COCHEDRAFT_1133626 [Bipolaris maydis C5]|uniref:Uncharacterized protein n=2 Tax=Cochliobolus heterostrophus TaxID=5016 RepID=M2T6A8_COCH5|nr:hypothetical protein COCHEDRAFT_1133626 [Bipolaris maydis C5]KAJ5025827.1 hypothetical protein J3E73DRAFT_232935 [Bipolaris maydis]KAJ5040841.1 hypothetical protein J3E74DRAFT_423426 [Bipolaris maydis]KAJ5056360.1 hypothetical protein J3E74DRAFT_278754 [Bipolaris maydis]KAJ6195953.1 hypothetical protein J3E72DRAFT_440156 [Bipolaris maydis]